ncbi:MAG: hypothetical protein P4M14_00400 [Gammaproteobacteria bacterium]|nr:hypothetical protein [Gammaproteobacteria bacterium]
MPKHIYFQKLTELKEFKQPEKATILQPLFTVVYEDKEHILKMPPTNTSPRVQNIRILNEAIYGKAAEIFSQKMQEKFRTKIIRKVKMETPDIAEEKLNETIRKGLKQLVFQTPEHHLVLNDDNEIVGVLTHKIPYHYIGEFGTSANDFTRVFSHPAMAMIAAVRYVLGDLDAYNNIGYDTEQYKKFTSLSSIDYGLAGFSKLVELDVLFPDEKAKQPTNNPLSFELSTENIVTSLFHRMNDVETFAHHAFGLSGDDYIAELSVNNPKLIKAYNIRLNNVYRDIVTTFTSHTFEQEVKEALGFSVLSTQNKVYFNDIFGHLIRNILQLREACTNLPLCSPSQLEAFAANNEIDGATTQAVLSGSYGYKAAQINTLFQQRVKEEAAKAKGGQLSPAHGGHDCQQILRPIPRRPNLWNASSWNASSQSPVSASSIPAPKKDLDKMIEQPILSSSAP